VAGHAQRADPEHRRHQRLDAVRRGRRSRSSPPGSGWPAGRGSVSSTRGSTSSTSSIPSCSTTSSPEATTSTVSDAGPRPRASTRSPDWACRTSPKSRTTSRHHRPSNRSGSQWPRQRVSLRRRRPVRRGVAWKYECDVVQVSAGD
jgi:hypothetical protein